MRYDNIILGFCYWLPWSPTYILLDGFHHPIAVRRSKIHIAQSDNPDVLEDMEREYESMIGRPPMITERAPMAIGVT